ncbi:MAG: glycosyltransferase family 9 protein [Chloroflexota bacterium]
MFSDIPSPAPGARRRSWAKDAAELVEAGWSHEWSGHFAEAESAYRSAVAADPSDDTARVLLGMLLLGCGDYEGGWAALNLHSGESLIGRSVCVHPDHYFGFGDQIQVARYIPLLAKRASRVYLLVGPPLVRLFSGLDGVAGVASAYGGESIRYTQMAAASLPHVCGSGIANIPAPPYFSARPDDIARWRLELPQQGLRVGVVWRGSTRTLRDPYRSLPSLAALAPLWRVPGVQFVSLQKGAGEDEARSSPLPLTEIGSEIVDFADTAAIVSQLDLVITVDTSVAHLAGALGKPVFLLLGAIPDWRWRHPEAAQRWYPTVRQFRQSTPGVWSDAVEAVAAALENLLEAQRPQVSA